MAVDPGLVVSLEARLDKFEKQLKEAGVIADRHVSAIEDRFSKSNPSFSGSFLGNFLANLTTKGLDAAVKMVSDLVDRFIDLEKVSKLTGESMRDLFGIQEAAAKFKVPVDETAASVKALAVLLDQMQRGEKNSLTALFDANPQFLKGVNRDALTLQQTLALVSDIVQNARTEIQKIDLAKAAGQTESMVKFLQQGGEAVTYLSKNAAATAPDLQKLADGAKAFDEAWREAVANVKSYLSQNLFDIVKGDLQDIIALLGGAVKFLGLFKGGLIDASTQSAASDLDRLRQSLINFKNAREQINESAGLDTSKSARDDRRKPESAIDRQAGTSTRSTDRPLSNVPLKDDKSPRELQSSFDRTEEQITKHTASVNADTIAVSQNTSVQAQLRAEFQLLNAIRKDEGEVTQAQIDQYTKLRATMSAEQALVEARINLTAAHKQSFIAASEGAALATAANTRAADSVAKLNSASSQFGSALSTAFADAVVEGKNLNEVVTSLVKTLGKASINSVFASFFNQQAGGGLSPFASLFGIGRNAEGTDNWRGGPTWVGEKGPEIVNLPRGAQVIPNSVARGATGSTFAPVTTIDARGMDPAAVGRFGQIMERHERALQQIAKSMQSSQRFSMSGVS